MGWHTQGYLESPTSSAPLWIVDCGNGEYQSAIQAYSGSNPQPIPAGCNLRIYYGTTGLEYFRGFAQFNAVEELKQVLQLFNGYPVYQTKWHGLHTFNTSKLDYYHLHGLLFFVERRTWPAGEWKEFVEDLYWRANQLLGTNLSYEATPFNK
ncbi:MAG TPA: hypothetical protein VK174_15435 [Chitinophagales bacterium]|nr:hypothetical protein [Chitinophagales bacterium]